MKTTTFSALLLSAALLAASGTAQVAQVKNTGCPNASYPTATTQPRIGTTFNVQYSVAPSQVAFAMMGWSMGRTLPFYPPVTCVAGPCNWYLAPIGSQYLAFPIQGPNGNWNLPIPNDRQLIFSTYAIQGGGYDSSKNCVELSGAISFAIMP